MNITAYFRNKMLGCGLDESMIQAILCEQESSLIQAFLNNYSVYDCKEFAIKLRRISKYALKFSSSLERLREKNRSCLIADSDKISCITVFKVDRNTKVRK